MNKIIPALKHLISESKMQSSISLKHYYDQTAPESKALRKSDQYDRITKILENTLVKISEIQQEGLNK